jgi:predicted SPOUT superfamily RNA methylase MTH1
MAIPWKEFDGDYVTLEAGVLKKLVCSNWRMQDQFKDDDGKVKPGLTFDVSKEDGAECEKTWTITARKAIGMLRPIIEEAEAKGEKTISISVIKVGEGKLTVYQVNRCAS